MKKLRKGRLHKKEVFSVHVIMIQRHFGGKRVIGGKREALIGEFIVMMSLFTFLLISIRGN